MTRDEREQLAADFALGVLGPEARADAEARASRDPLLRQLIEEWELRLAPLAVGAVPVSPPETLFADISRRIEAAEIALSHTRTVRAAAGEWSTVAPGLLMKSLRRDVDTGRETMLLKIAPGALYAGHRHDTVEEMFILDGDLAFGDYELGPGDYHAAERGGTHPNAVSRTGCTALVISSLRG